MARNQIIILPLTTKSILKVIATFSILTIIAVSGYAQENQFIDTTQKTIDYDHICIVEITPQPIVGYEKLLEDISKNIKNANNMKGKAFIGFVVDTLGDIGDFIVVKSFNKSASNEALRILSSLNPKFTVGKARGKLVKTRVYIPIIFDPKTQTK